MQKCLFISAVLFVTAGSFAVVGQRGTSVLSRGTVLNPFTLTVQPVSTDVVSSDVSPSALRSTGGGMINDTQALTPAVKNPGVGGIRPGPFTPPPRSPYTPPPR